MIKLKDKLKEEKILVPRHLETRDEEYKRIFYKKIQDYIKKGSKGSLNLAGVPIIKLPDNLIKVGGDLDLGNSQIQSLNNLQRIEGYLDLGGAPIQSLGNLKFIGENLYLFNSPIKSLDNLQIIKGSLYLWGSKIESLGNLRKVGEDLDLENNSIKSLGNLKMVGGNLRLKNTPFSKQYSKEEFIQMLKDKGIKVKGKIFI